MVIGDSYLGIESYQKILFEGEQIIISEHSLQKIRNNYAFLEKFAKDKVIYGINTGFGPMAKVKIEDEDTIQLQYNLIRSHCSGMGQALPKIYCKSALLSRLVSFLVAKSGVHESLLELMRQLINEDIIPVVYQHGGVGASGDLVQLAHLSLALIGEGEVYFQDKILPAAEVFKIKNIQPLQIKLREGLALMNGTSFMTGIGAVNTIHAQNQIYLTTIISAWLFELIGTYNDYFSIELNQAKKHKGQQKIALEIRKLLKNSNLTKSREEFLYKKVDKLAPDEKVQEYYSIRCTPQILGPIYDTIQHAKSVIEDEMNSASDNPVIDHENQNVYHGGNFHGDYVALEMDKLKISLTKLAMLTERQLNFLMNSNINSIFPPFLNQGKLGFNFGMQGIQFTATSTTAECQTLSNPMYIHSIPNNNDNQDIVSMGTNAALICSQVIENLYQVLSIQFASLIQASDILGLSDKFSQKIKEFIVEIQPIFNSFATDSPRYKELKGIELFLKSKFRNFDAN